MDVARIVIAHHRFSRQIAQEALSSLACFIRAVMFSALLSFKPLMLGLSMTGVPFSAQD